MTNLHPRVGGGGGREQGEGGRGMHWIHRPPVATLVPLQSILKSARVMGLNMQVGSQSSWALKPPPPPSEA